MVVLLVVRGIVDDVGLGVSLPAYAEGGRSATIHVQRIAGMEMGGQETGQLPGVHPLADTGPAAVHHDQDQVVVGCLGDGGAGMAYALVTGCVLIFQLAQILPSQGRIHETLPHRIEIVDQHGSARENVRIGAGHIESAPLRDILPLPVERDPDVPQAVGIDGRLALPVGHGTGEHRIERHAGPSGAVNLDHDRRCLVAGVHCDDGLVAEEDVGCGLRTVHRIGEAHCISGIRQVQVDGEDLLGRAGDGIHAREMVIGYTFGDGLHLPAVSGGRSGRNPAGSCQKQEKHK